MATSWYRRLYCWQVHYHFNIILIKKVSMVFDFLKVLYASNILYHHSRSSRTFEFVVYSMKNNFSWLPHRFIGFSLSTIQLQLSNHHRVTTHHHQPIVTSSHPFYQRCFSVPSVSTSSVSTSCIDVVSSLSINRSRINTVSSQMDTKMEQLWIIIRSYLNIEPTNMMRISIVVYC